MAKRTTRLLRGDAISKLRTLEDCSIDSIVTDPPYELGFMGKAWDGSGIAYSVELWSECLRVLKPGGHLLAFGGTRTYHRMAVAIEDAGFEIRDSIHWLYGSGFPKSLDVSKAIDKQRDDREDIYKVTAWIKEARDNAGISNQDIDRAFSFKGMAGHWTTDKTQPAVPTLEQIPPLLEVLGVSQDEVPKDIRRLIWDLNGKKGQPGENWAKREKIGTKTSGIANKEEGARHTIGASKSVEVSITSAATDAAKKWEGWGTALKPAHEPIVVARKPLEGTVAANVLKYGTGALNIDGSRIGNKDGRWPANIILDEDAGVEINEQSGIDAARFFYCAKPSTAERNAGLGTLKKVTEGADALRDGGRESKPRQNFHPTVKPIALMRYLVRLVTPPGGIVLDPFLGSGTTAVAAILEGFEWRGAEMTAEYYPLIEGRVKNAKAEKKKADVKAKTAASSDTRKRKHKNG